MCVAILKYPGIDLPDRETLYNCWINNPHGAGFVFHRNCNNILKKGFMDFDQFFQSLKESKILKSQSLMIHFRVASVGSVKKENCHPFVVSDTYNQMKQLFLNGRFCAAVHNGTFKFFKQTSEDVSDTMQLIKCISSVVNKHKDLKTIGIYNDLKQLLQIYTKENNCRLAIMNQFGQINRFGKWIKDNNSKLYFSNESYVKVSQRFALTQLQFNY